MNLWRESWENIHAFLRDIYNPNLPPIFSGILRLYGRGVTLASDWLNKFMMRIETPQAIPC
jgi:hypothetical protein